MYISPFSDELDIGKGAFGICCQFMVFLQPLDLGGKYILEVKVIINYLVIIVYRGVGDL